MEVVDPAGLLVLGEKLLRKRIGLLKLVLTLKVLALVILKLMILKLMTLRLVVLKVLKLMILVLVLKALVLKLMALELHVHVQRLERVLLLEPLKLTVKGMIHPWPLERIGVLARRRPHKLVLKRLVALCMFIELCQSARRPATIHDAMIEETMWRRMSPGMVDWMADWMSRVCGLCAGAPFGSEVQMRGPMAANVN